MYSAWTLMVLAILGGCTQRHLSIGAADEDVIDAGEIEAAPDVEVEPSRPRVDASQTRDADVRDADVRDADVADAGAPLDVKLRVFGREDIALLRAGCGAPCADFEVFPRGGTPPYQLRWIDDDTMTTRTLCPGKDILTLGIALNPMVTVDATDSSPGDAGRARAEISIFIEECPAADAGVPAWEVCLTPKRVERVSCPDELQNGLWFALEEPVDEANVSVRAALTGASFATSVPVELALAGELCGGAVLPVADSIINIANTTVQGTVSPRGARFVRLRNADGTAGLLPPGLSVSELRVCLPR